MSEMATTTTNAEEKVKDTKEAVKATDEPAQDDREAKKPWEKKEKEKTKEEEDEDQDYRWNICEGCQWNQDKEIDTCWLIHLKKSSPRSSCEQDLKIQWSIL